eukprot:TRINITY_DN30593_c1_g1_i3.p1 TRINITY_DN30593_c1_g1~~TRINITY_DN30593_c1_g1_i3.p1  ORF type:complete len:210 (-),score=-14.02 TRINITY_DN30593_c1_g1_i3:296-925(-)
MPNCIRGNPIYSILYSYILLLEIQLVIKKIKQNKIKKSTNENIKQRSKLLHTIAYYQYLLHSFSLQEEKKIKNPNFCTIEFPQQNFTKTSLNVTLMQHQKQPLFWDGESLLLRIVFNIQIYIDLQPIQMTMKFNKCMYDDPSRSVCIREVQDIFLLTINTHFNQVLNNLKKKDQKSTVIQYKIRYWLLQKANSYTNIIIQKLIYRRVLR